MAHKLGEHHKDTRLLTASQRVIRYRATQSHNKFTLAISVLYTETWSKKTTCVSFFFFIYLSSSTRLTNWLLLMAQLYRVNEAIQLNRPDETKRGKAIFLDDHVSPLKTKIVELALQKIK